MDTIAAPIPVDVFSTFLARAPEAERVEMVAKLAHFLVDTPLPAALKAQTEAALAQVLDDPSPIVRRALALVLAVSPAAPHALILALAEDSHEIAGIPLARSPVLSEGDLLEIADMQEGLALIALAMRPHVSARLCQKLVLREDVTIATALVGNPAADLSETDLIKLVNLFAHDVRFRAQLQARANLPAPVRDTLMRKVAVGLIDYLREGGEKSELRSRLFDEALRAGTMAIAHHHETGLTSFVRYLREQGHLTPALLLRSILGGDVRFLQTALAELTELAPTRILSLLQAQDSALSALLSRAKLPAFLSPVLIAGLRAAQKAPSQPAETPGLSRPLIAACLAAVPDGQSEDLLRLRALLRRYDAEALRGQAREMRREVETTPPIAIQMLPAPALQNDALCAYSPAEQNLALQDLAHQDLAHNEASLGLSHASAAAHENAASHASAAQAEPLDLAECAVLLPSPEAPAAPLQHRRDTLSADDSLARALAARDNQNKTQADKTNIRVETAPVGGLDAVQGAGLRLKTYPSTYPWENTSEPNPLEAWLTHKTTDQPPAPFEPEERYSLAGEHNRPRSRAELKNLLSDWRAEQEARNSARAARA